MAENHTKMATTLEVRHMGTYPFQEFHASWWSICSQKMGPNGIYHFRYLPRQTEMRVHNSDHVDAVCAYEQGAIEIISNLIDLPQRG